MASEVDFAVAAGMFIVFVAFLMIYMTGYVKTYTGLASVSELQSKAQEFFNVLFGGKGVPNDWIEKNITPFSIGVMTDLYRIPVIVEETSGVDRGAVTLNDSIAFDYNCEGRALNSTVRALENGSEIQSQLFDQKLCADGHLNSSYVLFSSEFSSWEKKVFYIYFSDDDSVAAPSYSLSPSAPTGFSMKNLPEEKLLGISASRMLALRNLTYDEAVRTLSSEYKVEIEISDR